MTDEVFMRRALALAKRGYGATSPNPMVGAVLVKHSRIIGQGWHRRAGQPHAEIEALRDAQRRSHSARGATLYVTLEPCCTHGRTPPCVEALKEAQLRRVIVAAIDPNPKHSGKGVRLLKQAGIDVRVGVLGTEATRLNESFNHWIVQRTPFVTIKAAMTIDGKIATASGESKWITGERARRHAMRLRASADAVLVGVQTVLADDPSLTIRGRPSKPLRRIILDSNARAPLRAKIVSDSSAAMTTVVVTQKAPARRVDALRKRARVTVAPSKDGRVDIAWLMRTLGREEVTSLLVEGGGEVNAAFLPFAHQIAFFYAPKILGGRDSIKAVAGKGLLRPDDWLRLRDVEWKSLGPDLLLTARIAR